MKNVNLHLNRYIVMNSEKSIYLPEEQDIRKTANTSFVAAPIFQIVRINRGKKMLYPASEILQTRKSVPHFLKVIIMYLENNASIRIKSSFYNIVSLALFQLTLQYIWKHTHPLASCPNNGKKSNS